jgi:hypothetical protein
MSLGNIMAQTKKIAGISSGAVLLAEKIKEKFGAAIKAEKSVKDGTAVYSLIEIKDRNTNQKFIKGFLERNKKKID